MTQIVLAMDRATWGDTETKVLDAIRGNIGMLKVGLEAMTAFGPDGVSIAHKAVQYWGRSGSLWDAKLHDIPNTVANTVRNLTGTIAGITIHASSGPKCLAAAVAARKAVFSEPTNRMIRTKFFGVTILTSHSEKECEHIFSNKPGNAVLRFARDCAQEGIDGLVCSPQELQILRDAGLADHFTTLVPGIRPQWAPANDQARTMTPAEATRLGADYIVVGRPIWEGPYLPAGAVRLINEEIAAA